MIKVFKSNAKQKDIDDEVAGNNALFEGTAKFDDQMFYQQGIGFLTEFCGEFETDQGRALVYEKCLGEDFDKILAAEGECTKDNVGKRCLVLVQMGHAIAISHEAGVVNRDIKPGNLMVNTPTITVVQTPNEELEYEEKQKIVLAKLIDQGTAFDLKEYDSFASKTAGKGTPDYMAVEMINGKDSEVSKKGVSLAVDIYSYGISIIETLIGSDKSDFWKEQVKPGSFSWDINDLRKEGTLFKNLSQENFLIEQKNIGKIPSFYTDEQCNFLQELLRDCLNPNPAERPSAAQVSELMQVFYSSFDANGEFMPYADAKEIAEKDRPKAIPIAISDMIFSADKEVVQKGVRAFVLLSNADPSYANTHSYGLCLLASGEFDKYNNWAKAHPEIAEKSIEILTSNPVKYDNNMVYGLALLMENKVDDFKSWLYGGHLELLFDVSKAVKESGIHFSEDVFAVVENILVPDVTPKANNVKKGRLYAKRPSKNQNKVV